MKPPRRIVVGMSSAALVLGAGTGIATAAHRGAHGGRNGDLPSGALVIASYLGLRPTSSGPRSSAARRSRRSPSPRGSRSPGSRTRSSPRRRQLDAAVAAGRLTAASRRLGSPISGRTSTTRHLGRTARRRRAGGPAIASYLGLTGAEIRTRLAGGESLAELATEQGKTVAGLEDAIVADAKTHLDAAVAAGKLTAAQETALLDRIRAHVDDRVNGAARPPAPPPVRTWPRVSERVVAAASSPRPGALASAGRQRAAEPGAASICRVPPVAVPSSGLRLAACVVARR